MTKILTKVEYLARLHKHEQHAKVVYFFTGNLLQPLPLPSLSCSSLTITSKTLFSCQQTHHRS
jgi:hypothetical protein